MLDGEPHTIVGVMPAGMRFPSRTTDVWLPLGLFVPTFPADRGAHPGLFAVAKLKPGISVERAVADMDAIARGSNAVSDVEHRSHRLGAALLRADRAEHPAGAARALGRRRLRAAHRLREPGEPDAGARRRPSARDRDPRGARRQPPADRSADADREPADGARRRRARRPARLVGRARVRRVAADHRAAHRSDRGRSARAGVRDRRLDRDRPRVRPRAGAARLVDRSADVAEGCRARIRRRADAACARRSWSPKWRSRSCCWSAPA